MNKFIIIGRLVRDPELKYTGSGVAVCEFALAVDRPYKSESGPDVDFFDCVVWRQTAENVAKFLTKGRQVAVEGEVHIDSYTNKNGEKRRKTVVNAVRVEFLGKADAGGSSGEQDSKAEAPGVPGVEVDYEQGDLPF